MYINQLKNFAKLNKTNFSCYQSKSFSILSSWNKNNLAFRQTKYDPTLVLEVYKINKTNLGS